MSLSCTLPRPITELGEMKSFDDLNKTDVVLSSTKAKDLEAAGWIIIGVTSWMD